MVSRSRSLGRRRRMLFLDGVLSKIYAPLCKVVGLDVSYGRSWWESVKSTHSVDGLSFGY
jgi:hypothetical protein